MSDTVVYMTDPEARYVSLVKRGANRTPFRIVKEQKETGMKIIQRIVAKKGTDVEAIKSAVGDEAAKALNLSEPKSAGDFTVYAQHPEEAFKTDSLEVVSLSDDNSVICLCGEMVEKSEGFVSKLLAKKSELNGIEVPASLRPLDAEVLKARLEESVYAELDAMVGGIHSILRQSEGKASEKLQMCRSLCDNFIASVEMAFSTMKADDTVLHRPKQGCKSDGENPETKPEKKPDKQPEPKEKAKTDDKGATPESQPDASLPNRLTKLEASVKEQQALFEKLRAEISKSQNDALESMKEGISELVGRVSKMEKAPAAPVSDHADSGKPEGVAKSQKSENVFAGLFGDLKR